MKLPYSAGKFGSFASNYAIEIGRTAVLDKRDIDAEYRRIRNKLRRFNALSIIDAALTSLHHHMTKNKEHELRSAPWVALLLVKWAFQDNMVPMRVNPPISVEQFDYIRNELWNLSRPEGQKVNVYAMLRQMFAGQMEFQKRPSWSFMRTPMLISRLPPQHPARKMFVEGLGIEPEPFMDISIAVYSAVLNGDMHFNIRKYFGLAPHYTQPINTFFDLLARDPITLRTELQNKNLQHNRGSSELYEFPIFRRFPLLQRTNETVSVWHQAVFSRGMEDAVHIRLSENGQDYSRAYSIIHEEYVVDLVQSLDKPYISEAAQSEEFPAGSQVEAIIPSDDGCLLVEAKMTLYNDGSLFSVNEEILKVATKRIRDGIKQVRRVAVQNQAASWYTGGLTYAIIVANSDLHLYTAERLGKIIRSDSLTDAAEGGDVLPLERIFIISTSEMESFVSVMRQTGKSGPEILAKAVEDNRESQTQKGYIGQHLANYVHRYETPAILEEASEMSIKRVFEAVGVQPRLH